MQLESLGILLTVRRLEMCNSHEPFDRKKIDQFISIDLIASSFYPIEIHHKIFGDNDDDEK